MSTAGTIILATGAITFSNEWYQTKVINWRIPIATLILAAGFEGISKLDSKAATGMAVMVLIAGLVTSFNGASAADTVSDLFKQPVTSTKG